MIKYYQNLIVSYIDSHSRINNNLNANHQLYKLKECCILVCFLCAWILPGILMAPPPWVNACLTGEFQVESALTRRRCKDGLAVVSENAPPQCEGASWFLRSCARIVRFTLSKKHRGGHHGDKRKDREELRSGSDAAMHANA